MGEKSRLKAEVARVRSQMEESKSEAKLEREALTKELAEKEEDVETLKKESKVVEDRQKRRIEELTRSLDIARDKYRKTLLAAKAKAETEWEAFQEWEEENGRPVQD